MGNGCFGSPFPLLVTSKNPFFSVSSYAASPVKSRGRFLRMEVFRGDLLAKMNFRDMRRATIVAISDFASNVCVPHSTQTACRETLKSR
jgi:hypothetical protein